MLGEREDKLTGDAEEWASDENGDRGWERWPEIGTGLHLAIAIRREQGDGLRLVW